MLAAGAAAAAETHFPSAFPPLSLSLSLSSHFDLQLNLQQLVECRGVVGRVSGTSIDIRIDVFGVWASARSRFAFKLSLNWIFYYVNIEVASRMLPLSPSHSLAVPACLTFAFSLYFLRTFHKDLRTNAPKHAIIFKADTPPHSQDFCLCLLLPSLSLSLWICLKIYVSFLLHLCSIFFMAFHTVKEAQSAHKELITLGLCPG